MSVSRGKAGASRPRSSGPSGRSVGQQVRASPPLRSAAKGLRAMPSRGLELPAVPGQLPVLISSSYAKERVRGLRAVAVVLGLLLPWSTLVPISGAVIAPGTLVSGASIKRIQHPTGGVLTEIRVHDGQHVTQNEVLARLDDTEARGNLETITAQLVALRARIARLTKEQSGTGKTDAGTASPGEVNVSPSTAAEPLESTLLASIQQSRSDELAQLAAAVEALGQEMASLKEQLAAKKDQAAMIEEELAGVEKLYERKLVTLSRVNGLRRDAAGIASEQSGLLARIAEVQMQLRKTQLERSRSQASFSSDVLKELAEAKVKQAELVHAREAAMDRLQRTQIRAPQSGLVHELAVHTVGGVIEPAQVLMLIAPDADDLEVEVHLPPAEIDRVHAGQSARVRLTAFDRATTPELEGAVTYVAPDATRDAQTGVSSYTVRIRLGGDQLSRLRGAALVAGMPAEAFLETGSRSAISYVLKPLTDQLQRMFRDP